MASKSRFVRHAILWSLTVPLVMLLVAPAITGPDGYAPVRQEVEAAERMFGHDAHERLVRSVNDAFRTMFVDTGAVAWTMRVFVTEKSGPLGVEGAASSVSSRWVEAFWLAIYQAMYRAKLASAWLWVVLPFIAAAFADGLAVRAIKRSGYGYNNPYAFHLAGHALIASAGIGIALLFAPVWIHPFVFPVLASAAGWAAWQAAANFQTGG